MGALMTESSNAEKPLNFIQQLVTQDIKNGKYSELVTRFPPEPNGYLHIGHAKSICLNFGLANTYGGRCFLRFDDTNPLKEEEEFVQAIIEDVHWLGFEWCAMTFSSDYYQQLYDYAVQLIEQDLAYVDSLTMEEIRAYRGTLQNPGKDSPYRDRSKAENLHLFSEMKAGKFPDGAHVLRAKIDMSSGNVNLRDPVLYRIRHATHQRTGDTWCIYPMYDYAHPISDALEHISHSLCTLEFQDHRPLYDWFIQHLPVPAQPEQTEFARLNLSHTVTSKRKLRELVDKKLVSGWDDPRLPTLKGMRQRGYPAEAIRQFCETIGMSRSDSVIDMSILEECVRSVLNSSAKRLL
jgi:glutaminyl-tRNA synthetase